MFLLENLLLPVSRTNMIEGNEEAGEGGVIYFLNYVVKFFCVSI
jgi:hypothetical protein